jgi:phasin family protein
MARENLRSMEAQLNQAMMPMQQFSSMFLENMERMADYQFDLMQNYTHFAVGQMRDALEIRDPRSFGEYMHKQTERVRELSERMSEDNRRLVQMGQESSRDALRATERNAHNVTQMAERNAEQAQRMAERSIDEGRRTVEQAADQAGRNGKLAIDNYDDLNVGDIEQRIEKLEPNQVRQLRDYERSNKNRKTLIEAFERRL